MAAITLVEVTRVFDLAKLVASGKMSESEAGGALNAELGMNYSSAMGYLRKRKQLLAGEQYTRTMNTVATRYFLERIRDEEGDVGLTSALSAVRKHIDYYKSVKGANLRSIEELLSEFSGKVVPSLEELEIDFQQAVSASRAGSSANRARRLASANPKPSKIVAQVTVFRRNPDVVAEVLLRANGACEECRNPAPFLKKSGLPYLEVHHRETLASGGPDTVINAEALCPNCHRKKHFGI
ncbi:MAG TPA: HNH endonuclease signature motif containing protein [Qipengyuania sp.]|nr:HNH endonuclease signature motif containing protein [Qipengyuania sp.]